MQQWSVSALCQGHAPRRSNAAAVLADNTLHLFGGCDETGRPSNMLWSLDLADLAAGRSTWSEVLTTGAAPSPRWGHTSFFHGGCLYVYGGFDGSAHLHDLHRLDLSTGIWHLVEQHGSAPRRASQKKVFQAAALCPAARSMLAFGLEPQDENISPALQLHAFDLDEQRWSRVPCTGGLTFGKLEALACTQEGKLLAAGWSPAGDKADSFMQVCCLDLSSAPPSRTPRAFRLSTTPMAPSMGARSWQPVQAQGLIPTARTSAAAVVLGDMLLLHGGMHTSHSVAGRLTPDTCCLDLRSCSWLRLAPSQERVVSSTSINIPRASHSAVALPSANAVLLIGGTSSRQSFASCDTIECLRQVPGGEASAPFLSPAGAAGDIQDVLSATPTLVGIQPFSHVVPTPALLASAADRPQDNSLADAPASSAGTAATPAVPLRSTPGGAEAAVDAALSRMGGADALRPRCDFSAFFGDESLSDVALVAGGVSFPAHRLLLCALSPRLAALLRTQAAGGSGAGGSHPGVECRWKLHLDDLFPDVLGLMLRYMYGCLPSIPAEAAPLLFKAAHAYGLQGLRAACLQVCIATIDLDNVCSVVLLAHEHKCNELGQACIRFVAASPERFQQMLATPGYLHLSERHPRIGQLFVSAATQLLTSGR